MNGIVYASRNRYEALANVSNDPFDEDSSSEHSQDFDEDIASKHSQDFDDDSSSKHSQDLDEIQETYESQLPPGTPEAEEEDGYRATIDTQTETKSQAAEAESASTTAAVTSWELLLSALEQVEDKNVPNHELVTIVVIDTEFHARYRDESPTTELGLAVLHLADARNDEDSTTSLSRFLTKAKTTQFRILEHAMKQHSRADRRGAPLQSAAYTEFGNNFWANESKVAAMMTDVLRKATQKTATTSPNTAKPTAILVGHAFDNDDERIANLGFNLADTFNVTATVDTQVMARAFSHASKPALSDVAQYFGINTTRRHHSGNDAFMTMSCLIIHALETLKGRDTNSIKGNPKAEAGAVTNSLRNEIYPYTTSVGKWQIPRCQDCGRVGHAMENCRMKCGFCKTWHSGHTWLTCENKVLSEKSRGQEIAFLGDSIVSKGFRDVNAVAAGRKTTLRPMSMFDFVKQPKKEWNV